VLEQVSWRLDEDSVISGHPNALTTLYF